MELIVYKIKSYDWLDYTNNKNNLATIPVVLLVITQIKENIKSRYKYIPSLH